MPVASLVTGFLLDAAGSAATVLCLTGVMVVVAGAAVLSHAVRDGPS